jgi:hypothetical protein
MEAVRTSETSVHYCETIRRCIPDGCHLRAPCRENLKSNFSRNVINLYSLSIKERIVRCAFRLQKGILPKILVAVLCITFCLILICFVDKAWVQTDNVIMLIHFFEERMRITKPCSCHANPSSRAVWGVGLDVLVAEIVGFESRLRHGYFPLYFCVVLSCVGKRLASG